jgi:uncharacterized protein YnzC (UPF0291/DUF896 family)
MEKSKIDRLNQLAKKAKTDTLTSSELAERDELRKEYIAAFRTNLKTTLDNTIIVDQQGNRRSLRKDN